MPVVPASDWVKAQKLSEDGVFKCTFKMKGSYIVPSSHLLRHLPRECKTPEEKKAYITVSRLLRPNPNPNPNCPRRHLTTLTPTLTLTLNPHPTHNQIWAKEYIALMKNPTGYPKMHDGSWDFDLAVDMLYSFWSVTPLSAEHPKVPSMQSPC